jgi:NTE family protein
MLDRLIEEPWLRIEAISGTLASAMNAVLMTHGWMRGGAEGAPAALDACCHCHVDLARRQPCRPFRITLERVSFDQRCITQ